MAMNFVGKGTPLLLADFEHAVTRLGSDAASLWALFAVETRGFGYLPDRRPQILFERHVFDARTSGRFSAAHPRISNTAPGGYIGGAGEYRRLAEAMALDETAALESASWGLGQVMGYNAKSCGFRDVRAMIAAMVQSEAAHLAATVGFIVARKALADAFRGAQWEKVAFFYNGKTYKKQHFDRRLAESHLLFGSLDRQPAFTVRTAQACLSYLGFLPREVDGHGGPHFAVALNAYRSARNLPRGPFDHVVYDRLIQEAGI